MLRRISKYRHQVMDIQIERYELLLEYQENGKWIREFEHMITLYKYIKRGNTQVPLDDQEMLMSHKEMRWKVDNYLVPAEILEKHPMLKEKCQISDEGEVLKNSEVRFNDQLDTAKKLIDEHSIKLRNKVRMLWMRELGILQVVNKLYRLKLRTGFNPANPWKVLDEH